MKGRSCKGRGKPAFPVLSHLHQTLTLHLISLPIAGGVDGGHNVFYIRRGEGLWRQTTHPVVAEERSITKSAISEVCHSLRDGAPVAQAHPQTAMITPRFSCSQTDNSVIVSIYCPSVRVSLPRFSMSAMC